MSKIAIAAIQDNKLFMVRIGDVWELPTLRQGNWLSEERAIGGRVQKEIGCPVVIRGRLGDFEANIKHRGDTSHLSVFLADLGGVIFIRNPDIKEWKYMSQSDINRVTLDEIVRDQVLPALIRQRLLIWPVS